MSPQNYPRLPFGFDYSLRLIGHRNLEEELKRSKEDSISMFEQMDSANEELKCPNEQIMSTNEELQSTNEELETLA